MKKLFFALLLLFSVSFNGANAMKLYVSNNDCNEQDCTFGFDLPNGQSQKRLIKSNTTEIFDIEAKSGTIYPYFIKDELDAYLTLWSEEQSKEISHIDLEKLFFHLIITDLNSLLSIIPTSINN